MPQSKPKLKAKHRVALLIDCDNQSHAHLDFILKEAAKEGELLIQRAYGNWSSPHLAGWRKACEARGVRTVQTPTYVAGKNTSDIALVIEAMDILHREEADAFCIVTTDSDFALLASRLRESGNPVIGIVSKGAAQQTFAKYCTRIVVLPAKAPQLDRAGNLVAKPKAKPASAARTSSQTESKPAPTRTKKRQPVPNWVPRVVELVRSLSKDGDCPLLSRLGLAMSQSSPRIDCKAENFKNLTDMLESQPETFRLSKAPGSIIARVCLTPAARKRK